jgi:hypothetical protein
MHMSLNAAGPEPADSAPHTRSFKPSARGSRSQFETDDYFGYQPTLREHLPDPRPLLENLARAGYEIIVGARDLTQIARWVTDLVYRDLLRRVVLGTRVRRRHNTPVRRPNVSLLSVRTCEPRDGVVEGTVILNTGNRVRAVAIRLEGMDGRWRAAVLTVL